MGDFRNYVRRRSSNRQDEPRAIVKEVEASWNAERESEREREIKKKKKKLERAGIEPFGGMGLVRGDYFEQTVQVRF